MIWWRPFAFEIRAGLAAVALVVLSGCVTHAPSQILHLRGVILGSPMTAEEVRRTLPGSTCLKMDIDVLEACTAILDTSSSTELLTVMLIEGRVGAIVAQFEVDSAEWFASHIALQLGDGERVVGQAGEGIGLQSSLDQFVLTWQLQDGSFVRLVKRGPLDPSKSAFIALSKEMNVHEHKKTLSGGRPSDRCWFAPSACPQG